MSIYMRGGTFLEHTDRQITLNPIRTAFQGSSKHRWLIRLSLLFSLHPFRCGCGIWWSHQNLILFQTNRIHSTNRRFKRWPPFGVRNLLLVIVGTFQGVQLRTSSLSLPNGRNRARSDFFCLFIARNITSICTWRRERIYWIRNLLFGRVKNVGIINSRGRNVIFSASLSFPTSRFPCLRRRGGGLRWFSVHKLTPSFTILRFCAGSWRGRR